MDIKNSEILELEQKISELNKLYNSTIRLVQSSCTHPEIGEAEFERYQQKRYARACLTCGLSTEQNHKLFSGSLAKDLVYKLTIDQYNDLVRVA